MTYKTLSTIHNLLSNKEHELYRKVDTLRKEFYDAEHLYEQELITKSELDSYEAQYRDASKEYGDVSNALREFDNTEWK